MMTAISVAYYSYVQCDGYFFTVGIFLNEQEKHNVARCLRHYRDTVVISLAWVLIHKGLLRLY